MSLVTWVSLFCLYENSYLWNSKSSRKKIMILIMLKYKILFCNNNNYYFNNCSNGQNASPFYVLFCLTKVWESRKPLWILKEIRASFSTICVTLYTVHPYLYFGKKEQKLNQELNYVYIYIVFHEDRYTYAYASINIQNIPNEVSPRQDF